MGGVSTSPMVRAPRIPTTNTTELHYGLSFLFVKVSNALTTYSLRAIIEADIELFTYDGNGGVLVN